MKPIMFYCIVLLSAACQSARVTEINRDISSIQESQFQPPRVLYHFGSYKTLNKSVHGKIPKNVWDKYIMGAGGGYMLTPYRRGYYGCANPHWCSAFAERQGHPPEPWMIRLTIKKECLEPSAWAVPRDIVPNFGCKDSDLTLVSDEQNHCDKAMNAYLNKKNIKIVFDEAMPDFEDRDQSFISPNSWYIRDRDCIEAIDGSPEELMRAMTKSDFWTSVSEDQYFVMSVFLDIIKTAIRKDPKVVIYLDSIKAAVAKAAQKPKNSFSLDIFMKRIQEEVP